MTTATHYERMQAAARELLEAHKAGRPVDPYAIEWARWAQRQQPRKMPQRPAIHIDRIMAVLNGPAFPIEGYFATEISELSQVSQHACAKVLHRLQTTGRIAMHKIPGRSRFYPNEHALEMGRALVEAQEARLKSTPPPAKAKKNPFNARPVVQPRPRGRPKAEPPAAPPIVMRAKPLPVPPPASGSVFIPPDVKVTRAPTRPGRYEVTEPGEGAGFLADWRAKRGEKA